MNRPVSLAFYAIRGCTVDTRGAREIVAPPDAKLVEWRLLTNRAVANDLEAVALLDWYRARWEIEMLFDMLKNACLVEALQLAMIEKLERALALFIVVAWRIAYLTRSGRTGQADQWIADLSSPVSAFIFGNQADTGLHHRGYSLDAGMIESYRFSLRDGRFLEFILKVVVAKVRRVDTRYERA